MTLVRSVLEYSAPIWDPHKVKDIDKLQRVQRRAARFVCGDYYPTSSVTAMIECLGWKDLANRRKELRLTLFHKVVHQLVAVPAGDILIKSDARTRSQHSLKFRTIRANTNAYMFSFFPRTIPKFASLPQSTAEAPSIGSFKSWLAPQQDQSCTHVRNPYQCYTPVEVC